MVIVPNVQQFIVMYAQVHAALDSAEKKTTISAAAAKMEIKLNFIDIQLIVMIFFSIFFNLCVRACDTVMLTSRPICV